jgi:hypothetical protein
MDIDEVLTQQDTPHYTVLRPMLWGSFNLSQTPIPYYQTVFTLEEMSKELELVENLPSDLRSKWRLEELFQREIDWERVDEEIVKGYLRRPEKLKFFNSLTVALLPLDAKRMLAKSYGDTPQEPELKESLRRRPWEVINVGGVQIITNTDTPHGYIRWDPKRIFPATIDGQHRLAALRKHYIEGNLPTSALETRVSVLFLVLDARVGFDIERMYLTGDDNPILTVVREVFIDLNKHAEEVERARRILLDDHEIESRCLREMLATRVGEQEEGKLPLGVVHWQHNVTAKFNIGKRTGPFVTTVELLYSILTDLFDLKRPKDPIDEPAVRKFVSSIEDALNVSNTITANQTKYAGMKPLIAYVERHHLVPDQEVPFANLPANYLRAAVDGFNAQLRPLIVGVLTRFKVYRDFISEVRKRGGIDGDLAFYLVQPEKAQKQTRTEWGETVSAKKIDEPLDDLAAMKNEDWPFFAVFQKGLLRASAIAWRHYAVVGGTRTASIEDFLTNWIEFLDELADRGLLKVKASFPKKDRERVWVGTALNTSSETVRWSDSAVQRIAAMLVLWWYFYATKKSQVGSFLKKIAASRSNESFPKGKELAIAISRGLRSVVVRADEEPDDEEVNRRIDRRLRDLIILALNKAAPTEEEAEDDEDDGSVAETLKAEAETPEGDAAGIEPATPEAAPDQGTTSS